MGKKLLFLCSCIFLLLGCSVNNDSNSLMGTVVRTVDGDTIEVKMNNGDIEKVRMILIDTPETKHPRLGVQPFGIEASDFTKEFLTDKEVRLELDVSERDRYGRLLAYVWADGENFNKVLVEEGLARVAIFPPDIKYVDEFEEVQNIARSKEIGIWSLENYAHEKGYNSVDKEIASNKDCQIKGNINSKKDKIYHLPTGQYYDQVIPEMWFCTEKEAVDAGFRASQK
ncbi:thermonuclease family protein [Bacillus sp. FSL K6-3431]|uniref:thermonuclease family protein n=1 Tax=Bacillus sp. FSL K6-3431 TaxID=2921500 RepID=UPI0030FA3A87